MALPQDGFFIRDLIFFGQSLSSQTVLAKGAYLELPDVSSASVDMLNGLQDQIRLLLAMVGEEYQLQLVWTVDSDYLDALENYDRLTEELATNRWTEFVRKERYYRYIEKMRNQCLRRERLALFFSRRCNTLIKKPFDSQGNFDRFLDQMHKNFMDKFDLVKMNFPQGRVKPMGDLEHYDFYRRFLNPSVDLVPQSAEERYAGFDPASTILENCLMSDAVSIELDEGVAFKMDDYYHSLFVIRRWPQQTRPGLIRALTGAVSLEYCITQNIFPIPVTKEIEREERLIPRIRGDAFHGKKQSLWTAAAKKEAKVAALMGGFTLPFNVLTIVRVWDKTVDGLIGKNSAIKTAIQSMAGAQAHQCNIPSQAKNLFTESLPGWTGGKIRQWDIYAEDAYLADMMPMTSTFLGHLESGEALYEGNSDNLVGVQSFASGTPQHAVLLGMTGAGKSVSMVDFLSQTECFYHFTAIIEEGLSYGVYTQLMGNHPIIVHPDTELVINYLDTSGQPISGIHISMAVSLLLKMIGGSASEDDNRQRRAMLAEYVNQLYNDIFEDWQHRNEAMADRLSWEAFAVEQHRRKMAAGSSFLDSFLELREIRERDPQQYEDYLATFDGREVLRFAKNPETGIHVRNLAFSYFKRADFPVHETLCQLIKYSPLSHHDRDETKFLATMLSGWSRSEGSNGGLFDGHTNIELTGAIAHFELGLIPESASDLKEAAGFLIANQIRNHIVTLPRGVRKRAIFEEVARFMGTVKGGDVVVSEYYSQLRKYNTWVMSIVQNYSMFKSTPLRPVIFNNSKMFWIMRQQDASDVADMAKDVQVPELAQKSIMRYPLIEHQTGREKATFWTYLAMDGNGQMCGTCKFVASKEMVYVAASSGQHFDSRSKRLAAYGDPFDGVMAENGHLPQLSHEHNLLAEVS